MVDIAQGCGDTSRDLGEQADAIQGPHLNLGLELPLDTATPVNGNPLGGVLSVLGDIVATAPVDHHAPTARHEADDVIAWNRMTAARIGNQ